MPGANHFICFVSRRVHFKCKSNIGVARGAHDHQYMNNKYIYEIVCWWICLTAGMLGEGESIFYNPREVPKIALYFEFQSRSPLPGVYNIHRVDGGQKWTIYIIFFYCVRRSTHYFKLIFRSLVKQI